MFKIPFLTKLFTPKPCPMDGYAGPVEWLQFKNWSREDTMECPRTCLEYMGIRDYADSVGEELGDKVRWISGEEKAKILAHHHTRIAPTHQVIRQKSNLQRADTTSMNMITGIVLTVLFYAFFAMGHIHIVRSRAKKYVLAESLQITPKYLETIRKGTSGSQMVAFVFHMLLALIASYVVLGWLGGLFGGHLLASAWANSAIYLGLLMLVLTPATIIVDIIWAYPNKVARAEGYVLVAKTASSLLKFQRGLAWVIWILFTIGLLVVTVFLLNSFN